MHKAEIQLLIDYNYWANGKVLQAAEQAGAENFTAPAGLSHGSLRGALAHILGAEIVWRLRWQEGVSPGGMPPESEFETPAALRQRWTAEEQAMRAFLGRLYDADINRMVEYKSTKGVQHENLLWQLIVHVVNHGTQFRGEAAVALTRMGVSPGDLDLIRFLRDPG